MGGWIGFVAWLGKGWKNLGGFFKEWFWLFRVNVPQKIRNQLFFPSSGSCGLGSGTLVNDPKAFKKTFQ